MLEDSLYSRLTAWLQLRTGGLLIIRDHLGQPRPLGPYGMVNLILSGPLNPMPVMFEYEASPAYDIDVPLAAEPFLQVPVQDWEWQVSFNVYATGAMDYAMRVMAAASSEAGMAPLRPLVIHRTSTVRRIPELINQRWEDRVQMDLFVHGLARNGIPVDVIEEASAEFAIVQPDDVETPVGNITVTKH